ncbi:toprim domain-containing protein [Flavobacterium sp. LPB0248]|uniref:toprim domain-containing protein n=1 Tax=Flavobacterium sp. LPB0248 TaxID=2614441 RepID=UPI0015A51587|nr:toprim domain-containing protein [Flavobacterium sp. LPB0248]QLC67173.1 toprim domain-containing protein [Flavobacterium sp. LPB0248]
MEKFSCKIANEIDLVDYLKILGHEPSKIKNQDYWYLSPLRNENTPSFKVNQKLNLWYDHGLGKGGNVVDFGIEYFRCTVSEFLQLLNGNNISSAISLSSKNNNRLPSNLSFANEKKDILSDKIVIVDVRTLENKVLLDYLEKRNIPLEIAKQHCREVEFSLNAKKQTAIGFKNNAGGYELRSENFKGSSSPKDITFIDNQAKSAAVFEGFFDYLSYKVMNEKSASQQTNFLILNSLSFFNKSIQLMEKYERVNLYLDRDTAGLKLTGEALQRQPAKYTDQSFLYDQKKDLNEWLNEAQKVNRSQNFRRSI